MNLSQNELAQMLGYRSPSTIAKIESGDNDIPQSKIEAFAEALQTTPAYLMGWIDDPTNYDDDDLIAELQGPVLDHFDGDVKKALAFQKAVAEDALKGDIRPSLPLLTPRDEREIARDLEAMINNLDNKNVIAAYNYPEDEEDRELLKASLLTSMRLAKQIAKKKFTPKKYCKE